MLPGCGSGFTWGEHDGFNCDLWQWKIVAVCGGAADFVEDVEAFEDGAEDGVLAVELGHGVEADIELAAVGIFCGIDWIGESGHGEGAFFMFEPNFGGEGPPGAACAGGVALAPAAGWVAGLQEGAGEGAVESQAVVEFFLDEFLEICDGVGSGFVVEADDDLARLFFLGKADLHDGDLGAERRGGAGGGGEEEGEEKG